jgi:hypothetical protein
VAAYPLTAKPPKPAVDGAYALPEAANRPTSWVCAALAVVTESTSVHGPAVPGAAPGGAAHAGAHLAACHYAWPAR